LARLRYRLVDVFTDVPFRGNPLCVVLDRCPEDLWIKRKKPELLAPRYKRR
jgi:predicted PhzF superfamily epimerase YddE/YHI9